MSAFVLENGVVYHAYSTYARGLDGLWGMYQWLDRAPKGATSRASGGAATTNTSRSLKTPAHVAMRPMRALELKTLKSPARNAPRNHVTRRPGERSRHAPGGVGLRPCRMSSIRVRTGFCHSGCVRM